jgi:putative ABC transport system permease protein
MTVLLRDMRFGLRLLRRNPGFAGVAILTLALGIAATTAIFSVVHGLFFAPLPYRQADRLVMVWEQDQGDRRQVSARNYVEWRRRSTAFSAINAWGGRTVNLATDERPESMTAGVATPGFLGMLGYGHPLALGRSFVEEEGIPGRDKVVILTYQLWQERFGGDPDILDRQVRIDGEPHAVVGVLGRGAADRQQNKVWLPLAFTEEALRVDYGVLHVMARLKDGVELAEANGSMAALSATLERERSSPREGWSVSVEPFRNNFVRDSTKRGIWLLLGAVMFLLLIACANVANLLLARGTARQRELAIRTSMGATRGAIVRQLIVESVIVALAGGALGALLASAVVGAIVALMPPFTLPSETEITLSVPVLLFALAACTGSGLLAGCAPAWQAARANVAEVMKEGGRSVAGGRQRVRRALVVLEFALALTLLAGGGMTVSALVRLMSVDLGFRGARTLTFDLPVARGRLSTAEEMEAFHRRVLDRTKVLPGVTSVSVSTGMPISGVNFGREFEIAGQRIADPGRRPRVGINMVTPDYHETFGFSMVRGRTFTERDRAGSQPVAIVNQAFVERYLPGVEPIGQRVLFAPFVLGRTSPSDPVAWEIVGVHRDVANAGPGREPYPEVEIPFWQNPWPRVTVAVQTGREAATVQPTIADVLRQIDPELPMANVRTIEQTVSLSMAADRFYTVFFAAFAAVALVLAAVGIYGVMSFSVAQRTHEIGLRMALGARQREVLGHVLREGMLTAVAGTALGAAGATLVGRALTGLVYGVDPGNPLTFVAVALTLLTAALLACVVPARRAASVDPMVALREE